MNAGPRGTLLAAAAIVAVALAGCSGARRERPADDSTGAGPSVAVFRGSLRDADGEVRRFRATLFVARPDRLRAEIAGPVGGVRLIVDGGAGRLAVGVVSERIAYVGDVADGGLEPVFGLAVGLEGLVRAILDGVAPEGVERFRYVPGGPAGWPREVTIEAGGVALDLELRRTRSLPLEARGDLGTGLPPEGFRELPLDEAPAGRISEFVGDEAGS